MGRMLQRGDSGTGSQLLGEPCLGAEIRLFAFDRCDLALRWPRTALN
jgi:hypothetical protein